MYLGPMHNTPPAVYWVANSCQSAKAHNTGGLTVYCALDIQVTPSSRLHTGDLAVGGSKVSYWPCCLFTLHASFHVDVLVALKPCKGFYLRLHC